VITLLERERELEELSTCLEKVKVGEGSAVAIEAGPGLGKTALLAEFRARGAATGLTVLVARMTELERDFPFALVRQLFEPWLTSLTEQDREAAFEGAEAARAALGLEPKHDPGEDSFAVLHALYWITAAVTERGPLILSIDDGHDADTASVDFLRFLLPRLEELPVFIALAVRPAEVDAGEGLGQVLADASMRHLKLEPLSGSATRTFLKQELRGEPESQFVAACHEVSGGNPFLLSELARTLSDREVGATDEQAEVVRGVAPDRVARMFQGRIAQLPVQAHSLVKALAVLGDKTDLRLVGELAGLEEAEARDVADQLRVSGVFSSGTSLQFIHPLVRNAIYVDITVGDRTEAHARAAHLLRNHGGSPELVAAQLLATEPKGDRETVETLIEASERALASGAPGSATAYLSRALREPPPADLKAAVLGPLIIASLRSADHSLLKRIEPDVFAELERDPSLRKSWTIALTRSLALQGRFEEAIGLIQEAVEIAFAENDVETAFHLEAQLITLSLVVPSAPGVDLDRYAGLIDPDSAAGRLLAAIEVGPATLRGTAKEASRPAKRALGNNGAIFVEDPEMFAGMGAVLALIIAEEMDAAQHGAERAMEIATERGATPDLARAFVLRGFVSWGLGDLTAAEADMRQAVELSRLAQFMPAVLLSRAVLIDLLIERDDLDTADKELKATGLAVGPIPMNSAFGILLLSRSHLRFEQGAMEDAADDFRAISTGDVGGRFSSMMALGASPYAARALVALGNQAQAQDYADRAIGGARRWGSPGGIAHALRAVAAAKGGIEGIATLEEASDIAKDSPRRLERAYALVELGVALRRENRRSDSRTPLREGFELARRCGAARLARWANAELQASGVNVRRYVPIGVESLTPSERRVAELAASGKTNRQIAQSLFVTLKTVEAHLSATYDKLDIESRSQLAAALEERP
jgi:DNA-binding CsgD family transcriptional regulator